MSDPGSHAWNDESRDEGFGWQKEVDIYGHEVFHPNMAQAAVYIEMVCNGNMPQLDWSSPGKRVPHRKSSTSQPDKDLQTMNAASSSRHSPLKTNFSQSPFDFDDGESTHQAFTDLSRNSATLAKLEPRKRVVGTLSNALAAQSPDRQKTDLKGFTTGFPTKSHIPGEPHDSISVSESTSAGLSLHQVSHVGTTTSDSSLKTNQELGALTHIPPESLAAHPVASAGMTALSQTGSDQLAIKSEASW